MTTGLQGQRVQGTILKDSDPAETVANMSPDGIVAPPPKPPEEVPEKKTQEQEATQATTPTQEQPENTSSGLPTLEELELEEQLQQKENKEEEELNSDPFDFELPDNDSAKKFREAFNKYLGFDVAELKDYATQYKSAITELNQIKQQNYINQSINNLANDWSVPVDEVNSRLEAVRERFKNYSPEMQARLDNVEGAKLIWSRIENESITRSNSVPNFNSNRNYKPTGNKSTQRMYTQAQIDNMSADEFNSNYSDILYAYANGLVN